MLLEVWIGLTVLQFQQASSQTLPDSISTIGSCAQLQAEGNPVCCELDERTPTNFFCTIQCFTGLCRCIDRITGELLDVPSFLESESSTIDCVNVFPTSDPPTTPSPPASTQAVTAVETTDPPSTTASPDLPTTERSTTDLPTDSPDPTLPQTTETSDGVSTQSETEAPGTEEEPTNDMCDDGDDDDSSSSESSSSSQSSSKKSRKSDSSSYSNRNCSSRDSSSSKSSRSSGSSSSSSSSGTSSSSSGSSSSTSGSKSKRCTRVTELLRDGCLPSCLQFDDRKCPVCRESCSLSSGFIGGCTCRDSNQVCIRVGVFGFYRCVDRPEEGEKCELPMEGSEDSIARYSSPLYRRLRRIGRRLVGAKEKILFSRLGREELECQNGTVCVEGSNGTGICQAENSANACIAARMEDSSITCTASGEFELLQCVDLGPLFECRCVLPETGEEVSGTQVIVADILDVPNCEDRVFRSCIIEVDGVTTGVTHGETVVDVGQCRTCTCQNGELSDCQTPQQCSRISRSPRDCTYRNRMIRHRERYVEECNTCGCYNGRIRCSRQQKCEVKDKCASCNKQRLSPVCGSNGVTYRSRCHAVFCEGQLPFKLFPGACSRNDICSRYPCDVNETCVRKGGIACIGDCQKDDFRTCVNLGELSCPNTGDNDTSLCATNGVTYRSLCRLLQDSKRESVAYAGECDSTSCSGGQVCGTDGVTYDNICALRSLAGNTRLDYRGECVSREGATVEDICSQVVGEKRCQFNASNCKRLVQPGDGCCPVCGGLVFIVMDLLALKEYSRINPQISNFDSMYGRFVESDIFSQETYTRCEVEITVVNRNIQLTLSSKASEDAEFCQSEAERIAGVIQNPKGHLSFLPDVMQFASAAVASTQQVTQEETNSSGALSLSMACATLLLSFFCVFI